MKEQKCKQLIALASIHCIDSFMVIHIVKQISRSTFHTNDLKQSKEKLSSEETK
jgi:hypothetical protein